jgi:hypothetical protein
MNGTRKHKNWPSTTLISALVKFIRHKPCAALCRATVPRKEGGSQKRGGYIHLFRPATAELTPDKVADDHGHCLPTSAVNIFS